MLLRFLYLSILLLFSLPCFSQTTYPKITGYFGILHLLVTLNKDETAVNFRDYYAVGFPTGINIWKNEKIGFSFEVVPNIKDDQGTSKVTHILFHPGILVALGHGYTFAGRAAFDSSGRYGITPVLNKTIIKSTNCSYFAAIPLPIHFGNNHPASFTVGFQFGIAF
ncbi:MULTISPECIES: hypothetical protein [Flavobacterium]|uniref:Uncharacterized protein n=2 Tax=Flavobacterium TaxID=237 RepID=A0A1S1JBE0_9FLAO|nr:MULTISPECIES: hypothetical protein [Flavobacterium]MCC9020515.1 hypothetical protein [Flavobacterium sp. F-126]OHT47058.1 hypothetical protein BHE19_21735 [Flavobacterium tructae]OXB15755.1 hypothetical protein B0A71_20255 [Flavobacterium tructae]